MSLRRALLPFVLAPVVLLVGCKPDGRDLEQTVNYYYGIGAKEQPHPRDTYRLLCSDSRKDYPVEDWIKDAEDKTTGKLDRTPADKVEVLRKEVRDNKTFAIVSVTWTNDGKRNVLTYTWVLERNRWRRVALPRLHDEAVRLYNAGDYTGAYA